MRAKGRIQLSRQKPRGGGGAHDRAPDRRVAHRKDQARPALLWPIAREIARTCAENGQNLVLEGCYIPADWRAGLDAATCAQVRAVCLALSEGFLRAQFAQVCAHASDVERRADENLTLDWLLAQNAAFAPYDAAHGWTRLCIEADYEREMQAFWEGSEWKTTF